MLTATLGGVVGPPEEAGLSDPTVSAGVAGVWVAGCMYFVFANLTFFLNNPGIVVFEKDGFVASGRSRGKVGEECRDILKLLLGVPAHQKWAPLFIRATNDRDRRHRNSTGVQTRNGFCGYPVSIALPTSMIANPFDRSQNRHPLLNRNAHWSAVLPFGLWILSEQTKEKMLTWSSQLLSVPSRNADRAGKRTERDSSAREGQSAKFPAAAHSIRIPNNRAISRALSRDPPSTTTFSAN